MTANIQYITNDSGQKTAVVVPLKEWEALIKKIKSYEEDQEFLSYEDEKDREQAFVELRQGKCLDLRRAVKAW